MLRLIHAHDLAAKVSGANFKPGLLMFARRRLAWNRQPHHLGGVGGHGCHVGGAVHSKGCPVPVAIFVLEQEIDFGAENQVAGAPEDLVKKGLLQAAHQGCTIFRSGSGDDGPYFAVSSQPTATTSMPSERDLYATGRPA